MGAFVWSTALTFSLVVLVAGVCVFVFLARFVMQKSDEMAESEQASHAVPRNKHYAGGMPTRPPSASGTTASLPGASGSRSPNLGVRGVVSSTPQIPSSIPGLGNSPRPPVVLTASTPPSQTLHPVTSSSSTRQEVVPLVAAKHLCPGLVVPHGNECILAVPAVPLQPQRDLVEMSVRDLDGKCVIQAEVVPQAGPGITQRPVVVLRAGSVPRVGTHQVQPLLAYCKASHEVGVRKSVYIYDARDELFANIAKDPSHFRYTLSSGRSGLNIFVHGDFLRHSIQVTTDQGQLMAEALPASLPFEGTGNYYKLKVVSNVDVGLILATLFAIDHLEGTT